MPVSKQYSRWYPSKVLSRFPETEFGMPHEMLEHRLLGIPNIVDAEVHLSPVDVADPKGESLCWVTVVRQDGIPAQRVLDEAHALITGCCIVAEGVFVDPEELFNYYNKEAS